MDPYIGEIRIFTGNFPPQGWAFCDGSTLPIAPYQALFAVIGPTYGGDGRTTFALPDLRGRVPIGAGTGGGLTPRRLGETGGSPTVTLVQTQMASHSHQAQGAASSGTQSTPGGAVWAQAPGAGKPPVSPPLYATTPPQVTMNPQALGSAGGNQPHNNVQPAQGVNYIIATQGIFPPRS